MKKLSLFLAILLSTAVFAFAQKFAYVDSEYILKNIPDYKAKQSQLDEMSVQWQKEIETKYAEIDKMYKSYQAEQILLTEEMKKRREDDIMKKEKEAKDIQKSRFGFEGELFKKRQELVKPIQDKVYNAIKEIATTKSYAVIFDKSSNLTMLFTNPKYDMSDEVLEAMGFKATNPDKLDKNEKDGKTPERK